ncbi:zinc protease [Geothermobacter ehrlichii]|uniref:Zinc protease n=1 Tax=Geothermobacter ehrlichii TaxID=213224 RepID=A0A5D3WML5_9BACT|nr:pitrilysin family protein [Geothermobacter ehrlichii]TYO98786.1 zinc protease [Geothermobacter ehrlichii]
MIRLFSAVLSVLLLAGCQLPADRPLRPEQLSFVPLKFEPPAIERIELPNGIRLYLKEDHELPLVRVTAMLGAGSLRVPEGKEGLAALHAGLLRSGGAGDLEPAAFDERLALRAIDLEASADSYTLSIGLSARSDDLQIGLAALRDMLLRPRFDGRRLELLRRQTIEGIRRRNDEPSSVARRALWRNLYPGHPLGREATVASVAAIGREDIVRFHRRFVAPNNLWLAVSGDFDRRQLLARLTELFGGWNSPRIELPPVPPLAASGRPALWVADKKIPQTTILFGEIGLSKDNPDVYAVRVMNFILGGGGFNSRLMREVRSNRGLAYSVYSYYQIGRLLPGPFIAGCETKTESTGEVVRLMRRLMRQMRDEPVSQEELRLAKESLINSFVFAFEDLHDIVTRQMRLDFYGYPTDYLPRYRERLAAVTVEDVQRVARRYLHPDRQLLVLVGDKEAFAGDLAGLGLPVREVDTD